MPQVVITESTLGTSSSRIARSRVSGFTPPFASVAAINERSRHETAIEHCTRGASIWKRASYDEGRDPEVILASAGDIPTLEMVAAVWYLRKLVPDLRVRVVNVVDLMKLFPASHHPHGMTTDEFVELFTADKPVVFAFHGYQRAIHEIVHGHPDVDRIHVRGFNEQGTTTTPFQMVVMNELDRFHLAEDVIDRLPQLGARAAYFKQAIHVRLIEHKEYIDRHGDDMPAISGWKWAAKGPAGPRGTSTEGDNV